MHTCVSNMALCVQKIQSLEQILQNDGKYLWRQSPHWISMKQREHAVPQRWVYEAEMLSVRVMHIKTIKRRPDGTSAGMTALSRLGHAIVYIELII